jgi:colanic acid biosynthesis glycosyl transferase WcaI
MRVLLMAQHYAPEEVSGAVLATELAEDLAARGHRVDFVTTAPSYPKGVVFPGYKNAVLSQESRNGVRITRVWSYITPRHSFWRRILNFGTFSLSAFYGGLAAGRPDVILSYSPPLPLGVAAWLLSRLWRVPWVLRVEDLYPEAAVATGVLKNRYAISFFHALARFLYRRASRISVIAEAFRRRLIAKGVPDAKLSVTPVWADPDLVRPTEKRNGFRAEHGLEDRFVVLYAGALGLTSSLEDVIAAADRLRGNPQVTFVLVGEGVKKASLVAERERLGLPNVLFLPFQPRARFAEMLAAADVSLVTLNSGSSDFSMPSKTLNILASGRAILSVTPEGSEVARVVREGRCGVNVEPGDPDGLAEAILRLASEPAASLDDMGWRGRELLEARYTRDLCVDAFEKDMRRAVAEA